MKIQSKIGGFVKTHKMELAIAAAAGLTAVGVVVAKSASSPVDLPKPKEFSIGTILELWTERQSNGEEYINAIIDNLTAADLGQLGEEMAKVDGIEPNSMATIIIGFKKK